jgi:AcrR family transcriptional regulator
MKKYGNADDSHGVREALLGYALKRLQEGVDPDALTAREISTGADCAVGLISYHFGGKDNLVREAAKRLLYEATGGYFEKAGLTNGAGSDSDSASDWDAFIDSMAQVTDAMFRLGPLGDYLVRQTLLHDDFSVAEMILPTLRARAARSGKPVPESVLRIRALHFILGLQALFVRRADIPGYVEIDLLDRVALRSLIADLAEALIS